VTCATPLLGKIICAPARLSQEEASSAIVCQKFSGPCDLSHAHFGESYLFMRLVGIPYAKLRTKFEVSSWSSIEDMFDRMPKIEGSREQGHAPFMEKLFMRQLGFPKAKLLTKFEVSGSCSFEVMFDCRPKIWGVTWYRPRPFWGKLFVRPLGFSKAKLWAYRRSAPRPPQTRLIRPNFWDDPPQVLGRSARIKLHQIWTEVGINDAARSAQQWSRLNVWSNAKTGVTYCWQTPCNGSSKCHIQSTCRYMVSSRGHAEGQVYAQSRTL